MSTITPTIYLPPLDQEEALQKGREIDNLIDQICAHELKLNRSYARLASKIREVKVNQYWIPLGYDKFSSYFGSLSKKIGRERSQMYAILSVSEVLHPYLTDDQLEVIGVTKAHELKRLVQQNGRVLAEIPDPENQTEDTFGTVALWEYASRPDVTAAQLRVKVNELLHIHEAPKGLWLELEGFYATPDERKEIEEFWALGKQVLQITTESEHEVRKQVFLAAARESISTWRGELANGF